ncbi:MAG: hypothetical protein N2690_10720 [Rhodocyclaceae bacterium]|nr:hypothetical protein [Rhodocyclaceae bacterium]
MAHRLIGGCLAVWLVGAAQAQWADPTRPPANLAVTAEAAADAPPPASGLQSIILRKQGKPAALINGEIVELGGKVGEARLVKISEDRVVLRGPMGEETLRLMPAAAKQVPAQAASSRSRKMKKESER